jgi:hypothetical protein
MIQYNLVEESVEIKFSEREKIKTGCTTNQPGDRYPKIIKKFTEKEEALDELKKYKSTVRGDLQNHGISYYLVTEYYVEEIEVDEDGEFVDGGGIWEFSEMPERTEWE